MKNVNVRAKFECTGLWKQEDGDMMFVNFIPVMDGSPENLMFGQVTASGDISMGIDTTVTDAMFIIGAQYYVDFTLVE